jgi:teichuronic acid biosynthesis glycosyltransferase TuaC
MRVLLVCSGNHLEISPFIREQVDSLINYGLEIEYYLIKGKGLYGYLKNINSLFRKINNYKPEIIHAHYGLCGFLAVMQRKVPVVVTYHGSDINYKISRGFSILATKLSAQNIFVSKELANISNAKKFYVIPCGVNLKIFSKASKSEALKKLQMEEGITYVLFSSSFSNKIKNYPLAKKAVQLLQNPNVILVELKGYSRDEVSLLMNAVDLVLVTSVSEGSSQFIKEAMACNCPVVSTDVGDIREVFGATDGHYLCSSTPQDVAEKIIYALEFRKNNGETKGRDRIIKIGLDSQSVAKKVLTVYNEVLNKDV